MIAFCRIRRPATGAQWILPITAFWSNGREYVMRTGLNMEGSDSPLVWWLFPCEGHDVMLIDENAPSVTFAEALRS